MNVTNVGALSPKPLPFATWYRAFAPAYLATALQSGYTKSVRSRFSDARPAPDDYEILYFADSSTTALYEVGALFGPFLITGPISNPRLSLTLQSFTVVLSRIVDLSDVAEQGHVATNVQELTGDWKAYRRRKATDPVHQPSGIAAPTQDLGLALFQRGDIEGFVFTSAQVPTNQILAVFPQRLRVGSYLTYTSASGSDRRDGLI